MATCLIVEDELTCRKVACALMNKFGLKVVEAEDVPQAIDAFSTHQPDVILLDWRMPGMDGMDLLKYMQFIRPELKPVIIMSTVVDDEVSMHRALKAGADAYLVKPLKQQSLYECLVSLKVIKDSDMQEQEQPGG